MYHREIDREIGECCEEIERHYSARNRQLCSEIDQLRTRLAERDELLRECHDKYHAHNDGCDQHADGIDGDCDCGLFVFLERVESAINPAPVQADEQNCGDCGDDGEEPNPDCHTCGGSGAKR